jgi:hypothetical protein
MAGAAARAIPLRHFVQHLQPIRFLFAQSRSLLFVPAFIGLSTKTGTFHLDLSGTFHIAAMIRFDNDPI